MGNGKGGAEKGKWEVDEMGMGNGNGMKGWDEGMG
jgi:hypothetical protein